MSTTQPEIFSWTNQPETWDQNINYEILKRTQPGLYQILIMPMIIQIFNVL